MSSKPQPLSNVPPEFETAAQRTEQMLGFVPNSFLTMAKKPALANAVMPLLRYLWSDECSIERPLRPLISYMTSYGAGCRYCQAHSSHAARIHGVDAEKIENLWRYDTSELFDERERAVLAFAFASGQQPNAVEEQHFTAMRRYLSEEQIIDVAAIVAIFGLLNRWNDSMATALEDIPIETARSTLNASGWTPGKH